MKKLAFIPLVFILASCADNKNPDQPASDELRSVEGTERNNVQKSDTSTHENANEQNTVSPEPPSKHGL